MTGTEPDHVLVVDDDDDIREMLQSSLSFAGFRVSTAADAQTALAVLTRTEPDAMVLDVMMPGIDGFDLLQLLRQRGDTLPVLFLSARDAVEDRVRGLRLGADDYIAKPFSVIEVTARLESLLRRVRTRTPRPLTSRTAGSSTAATSRSTSSGTSPGAGTG